VDAIKERGALRHRNFTLFLIGQVVSFAGNGIFMVALPLEVLRLTADTVSLGLVVAGESLMAVVLMLFGGALVDRFPKRTVLMAANAASALAVAVTAALVATNTVKVWELGALTLVFGASNAIIMPASMAIVVDLLPGDLLVSGNAMRELGFSLGQALSGPLLGGLIVATIGYGWAFGINGASFAIAFLCLAVMSRQHAESSHGDDADGAGDGPTGIFGEIREGITFARAHAWLWWNIMAMSVANFAAFLPLLVTEPLLVKNEFHAGAAALSIVLGASGAGGVAASIVVKLRGVPAARVPALWACFALAGVGVLALGLSNGVPLAAAAAFVIWAGITAGNLIWFVTMQERVPPSLMGRVSALDWMLSLSASPLGIVAGSVVAAAAGVRLTLVAGSAIVVASAGVALFPRVRSLEVIRDGGAGAAAVEPAAAIDAVMREPVGVAAGEADPPVVS